MTSPTARQCTIKPLTPEQIAENRRILDSVPSAIDIRERRQAKEKARALAKRFSRHERRVGSLPRGIRPKKPRVQFQKQDIGYVDNSPETYVLYQTEEFEQVDKPIHQPFQKLAELYK